MARSTTGCPSAAEAAGVVVAVVVGSLAALAGISPGALGVGAGCSKEDEACGVMGEASSLEQLLSARGSTAPTR
jgi:hypothetical protein